MKDQRSEAIELLNKRSEVSTEEKPGTILPSEYIAQTQAITDVRNVSLPSKSDPSYEIAAERGVSLAALALMQYLQTHQNPLSGIGGYQDTKEKAEVKKEEQTGLAVVQKSKTELYKEQKAEYRKAEETYEINKSEAEEIERGGTPDKNKSKERSRQKAASVNPKYYEILGVDPDAPDDVIKAAYRKIQRTESYDIEAGKLRQTDENLTTEEIDKILAPTVRRLQDVNEAYAVVGNKANRKVYDDAVGWKRPSSTSTPKDTPTPSSTGNYAVVFTPTSASTKESQKAVIQTQGFRDMVQNSNQFNISPQDLEQLKSQNVLPADTTSQEILLGLNMYSHGGSADKLIDLAESNPNMSGPAADSIMRIALVEKELEEANLSEIPSTEILMLANGNPDMSLVKSESATSNNSQTAFRFDGTSMKHLFQTAGNKTQDLINKALRNNLTKALEKGGKSLVKQGAEIAIKTGLKTAISTAAESLNAVIPGLGLIVDGLLKLFGKGLEKILSWLKRIFKENKEVAAILGLGMLGFGAAVGSIPLIVIGGGILTSMFITAGPAIIGAGTAGAIVIAFTFVHTVILASVASFIGWIFLGFILLTVFIVFIINTGAYVVTPNNSAFFAANCSPEKIAVSFPNTNSSGIAKRAWEITDDLYQGFWCYWNRSPGDLPTDITLHAPSYPDHFDYPLFLQNPFPPESAVNGSGQSLFWCTNLVNFSYAESGGRITTNYGAASMSQDFKNGISGSGYVLAKDATSSNIVPGSAVFFSVGGAGGSVYHVGVVHHIECGGPANLVCSIIYVQSNAGEKQGTLTITPILGGVQSKGVLGVDGFGLP